MTSGLLEVAGVSVAFGGLQALRDVTLTIPEHHIVGLIGPNGAGKTTLFNVISGLQRCQAGSMTFAGIDVTSLGADKRAGLGIARSFQNLGLISDETVMTNLLAAQHLSADYSGVDVIVRPLRWLRAERRMRRAAEEAAAVFNLTEHLNTRVSDLSFGIARFVELACVLVETPDLMLLDEPTTGLDVKEVAALLRVLQEQRARGTTILLVAHDVRFTMDLCDYIYVLAEGRILFHGPPSEVQRHPEVIEVFLGRPA
jgi:branched-chain amino acid transport system ATP-binding protein